MIFSGARPFSYDDEQIDIPLVLWHLSFAFNIVRKYDVGGSEEDFGNLGHKTVINALKLFQEFASITP